MQYARKYGNYITVAYYDTVSSLFHLVNQSTNYFVAIIGMIENKFVNVNEYYLYYVQGVGSSDLHKSQGTGKGSFIVFVFPIN